ncbi:hypothetical protein PCANC_27073 [Puccinia coronata f. sp. avenae]|uniref:Uncharacterized protein n=1 Tax=Puccinia coronata f. sp. avenae TaxID=200324 RepID=A0A2N5TKS5_9BASI|nr:hypothetical protein PCANC_27073 [Puccinia coronata f. sp. avenae]
MDLSASIQPEKTWPSDAAIFTVAQLRYYLKLNLGDYPDGSRQHLVVLYNQHLAGRFRPENQRFDWPAPSDLNVPGLKQILTEYQVKFQSSDRRNILEDLYDKLKTSLQAKKVVQKTERGVETWAPSKRPRLENPSPSVRKPLPPLRARPRWLVKRQADKSKVAGQPETRPVRRSARIGAKADAASCQAPKGFVYESDTKGKKRTTRRATNDYPPRKRRCIRVVIPVPRRRPKSRRQRRPERATSRALQDGDPTSNIDDHGTSTLLPLIDFSYSVPVDPTPTNDNEASRRHEFDRNIFPLIDCTSVPSNESTTRPNPLLEMLRSNQSNTQINPLLDRLIALPEVGVDIGGERTSALNNNVNSKPPLVPSSNESLVSSNKGSSGVRNDIPDSISTQTTLAPIITSNLSTHDKLTQLNTTSDDNELSLSLVNNHKASRRHEFDSDVFPLIDCSVPANESTTRPTPLEVLRSNQSNSPINPLLDRLIALPEVGVDIRGERTSPLNNNVNSKPPLVPSSNESLVSSNKGSSGVCNDIPDSISTQTILAPIITSNLSTHDKLTQLNTTSDDDELSLALVPYTSQNINTPASIDELPPSSDLPPLLSTATSELLPSPSCTEKTAPSNPIAEPDKISHVPLATVDLTLLTSTHLKSNPELLHQLITFPQPPQLIAAPPILASKSHLSGVPGNILPPGSDKDSVSDTNRVATVLVFPEGPQTTPTETAVPRPIDPSSPADSQFTESTLEYLDQTSIREGSVDFAPGSVSELPDPVLSPELPEESFEVSDQRVEAPLPPDSEHPVSQSALLTTSPHSPVEENNPKTPTNAFSENTHITTNMSSIGDLASSPIRNRTKRRLIIEDSDDDSTPVQSPVSTANLKSLAATSLAALLSPAAVGPAATNLAPTVVMSGTVNLPRPPEDSSESTAATRPHNANLEMVDETLNGSRVCDWPDPDGKITAAQIRPILRENNIHYKMADSKAVLLAKYKLLFSDRQGNTPRYDLRQRDLVQVTSSTSIPNPPSVEVPSAANPRVSAGEPGLLSISSNTNVQPDFPRPESQPNQNTPEILNLIDMETSSAMSVQPMSPNIARPTENLRPVSVIAARRTEPADPGSSRPEPADPGSSRPEPAVPISSQPEPAVPGFRRPEPAVPVSNWASDVFVANNNMDRDTSVNSPSVEVLISSINSLAQTSVQIGTASLSAVRVIAEGFTSLNSLIDGGQLNLPTPPSRTPAARGGSGRSRSQALFDNMEVDTPTTSRRPDRPNLEIQAFVRQHCATLFGRCARDDKFPEPATAEERRAWIRVNLTGPGSESDEELTSVCDYAMDLDGDDPDFPYGPDGPGHSSASPQALKIIWRAMRDAQIKSFRPDLSKAMTSPANRFLWEFAQKTFMRVVRSGEYDPLTKEMCDQVDIKQYFTVHVQSHLMRISYHQRLRLHARRESEKTVAVQLLVGLIPVIESCCSDDETDDEADRSLVRPGLPMRAVVHKLPWRNQQVERVMIALDRLQARRREYATQRPNTPPPQVRRRPQQPKNSTLPYVEGLPISFYDESWLKSLSTHELQELNSKVDGPPLEYFVGLVERIHH